MSNGEILHPLTSEERRAPMARLFKQLNAERTACAKCTSGTVCKEPHAKPCKTIAWAMDVREYTVVRDVQRLIEEWRSTAKSEIEEYHDIVLRNLAWAEKEVIAEWERSKKPMMQQTTTTEAVDTGDKVIRRTRAQRLVREQTGTAAYMSTFMAVQMQRRDLLGLDAPKKIIPLNPDGTGMLDGLLHLLAQSTANNVIDITPHEPHEIEYLDVSDVPIDSDNGTHAGNGRG